MSAKFKHSLIRFIWIALLLSALAFTGYLHRTAVYQARVRDLPLQTIDFRQIGDGTYIGECDVDFIYVKAAVTIRDGTLANVSLLEHRNERGVPAERILDDMVRTQQIQVDTVSGATNSSKVIQQAVINALEASGA